VTEEPLHALVARVRTLVAQVRSLDAPDAVILESIDALDRVNERLLPHVYGGPYQQASLRGPAVLPALSGDDPAAIFPYSPIVGGRNPIAPPVRMWRDGDRMRGCAQLGAPYAGPPATVHGGVVALVFDELLGALLVALGLGGFTGTLSVRYLKPTPLGAPIELEGWLDRVEGRKAFAIGEIRAGGETTARAEGVFIKARAGQPAGGDGGTRG
jgi:hypothetical protein